MRITWKLFDKNRSSLKNNTIFIKSDKAFQFEINQWLAYFINQYIDSFARKWPKYYLFVFVFFYQKGVFTVNILENKEKIIWSVFQFITLNYTLLFLFKDVKYKLKSKLIYPLHRIFSELKSNRIRRVNFIWEIKQKTIAHK
jgi:hypothetical protein